MKKGVATVAMMIIILVSFLVILAVISGLWAYIGSKDGDIKCHTSLMAHSTYKAGGKSPVNIQCARKNIEFEGDRVKVGGAVQKVTQSMSSKKKESTFDSLNSHIVNQVIAKELVNWWGIVGEGRLDIFNKDLFFYFDWDNSETICLIRGDIIFPKGQQTFSGLIDYLKKTNTSGHREKMYDYLASETYYDTDLGFNAELAYKSFSDGKVHEKDYKYVPDTFDTSKQYVMFLRAIKKPYSSGILSDKSFDAYSIHIMEQQQYLDSKICDHQYN